MISSATQSARTKTGSLKTSDQQENSSAYYFWKPSDEKQ